MILKMAKISTTKTRMAVQVTVITMVAAFTLVQECVQGHVLYKMQWLMHVKGLNLLSKY